MSTLRGLGPTQQALLRHLLRNPDGSDVESLCLALRVSHNAVRQHLTAVTTRGWVERATPRATGGRPQARYRLSTRGQELFPRNYSHIAIALLEAVSDRLGREEAAELLGELGRQLGSRDPLDPALDDAGLAAALSERLDRAGYESVPTVRGGEPQVEAFNCVFHAVARRNPDVCRFDIAFMEAATGRAIAHRECIVRGGRVCRFAILPPGAAPGTAPPGS